jgi:hypothetical protein
VGRLCRLLSLLSVGKKAYGPGRGECGEVIRGSEQQAVVVVGLIWMQEGERTRRNHG